MVKSYAIFVHTDRGEWHPFCLWTYPAEMIDYHVERAQRFLTTPRRRAFAVYWHKGKLRPYVPRGGLGGEFRGRNIAFARINWDCFKQEAFTEFMNEFKKENNDGY